MNFVKFSEFLPCTFETSPGFFDLSGLSHVQHLTNKSSPVSNVINNSMGVMRNH